MKQAPEPLNQNVAPHSIAFIGGGNMARSLIGGLIRSGIRAQTIAVAEPNDVLRDALSRDFSVAAYPDNTVAASDRHVLVLAVKPQVMKSVCQGIRHTVQHSQPLIISIAAGIVSRQIEDWLGGNLAVVRSMPNTPALIGAGATGLFANPRVSAQQKNLTEQILASVGLTAWIAQEEWMDVVTALSGSGPAYFFLLMEALEEAAQANGLPREIARALATHTCLGAGRMAVEDSLVPPSTLRERVTSPGGTTQAALDSFASGGFRELVARAVKAATERGRELSKQWDTP